MKVIGITGGVGSGKSYVAELAAANFDVLHVQTDNIARRQMLRGGASYEGVVKEFGEGILLENGEIDRAALAAIVFGNEEKRKRLNELTHPFVTNTVKTLMETAAEDFETMLVETAILYEAGYDSFCDEVWFVQAPKEERIARVMRSRGYTRERAESMIAAQASDEVYEKLATHVIDNSDSVTVPELVKRLGELLSDE